MDGDKTILQPSEAQASSSSRAAAEGTPIKKQVQLVGAPPVFHGAGRKAEPSRGAQSDDDDEEEQVEEDGAGQDGEDKARTVEAGEINDEDLLAEFDEDEDTIHLTHLRLTTRSLRKMSVPKFSKTLRSLSLRQNEISKISDQDIGTLTELTDLDLYDNGMEKTYGEVLKNCTKLESLDYSFNSIRHISHLSHLSNLQTLYLIQNKISKVRPDDFGAPLSASLRSLELGGNKLRSLENLGHLTQLEELWVGKNKITKLEHLSQLKRLKTLSIQSNRITKIENLEGLVNLEELYLSHNGLEKIEGLSENVKLTTLDIGGNRIQTIEGIAHLRLLNEFWANDNKIDSIAPLEAQLGPLTCPELNTVYLENNPVQKTEGSSYRKKIMLSLPQISQIDATFVRRPV
ncbi:hypothetical protein CBS101457_001863 [Exobasidium rhododendri]|nr:hypothetical protein CBS101457_001863 [Exobasidium rhododendri]